MYNSINIKEEIKGDKKMKNGLDIQIRANLIASFKSPHKDHRQTERGIAWAIEFLESLTCDVLSDSELNHAIRLSYFRGNTRPVFHN